MPSAKTVQTQDARATVLAPTLMPPSVQTNGAALVEAEPVPLTEGQMQMMAGAAAAAAPALEPPTAEAAGATATVWVQGKKVAALWSINQNRNSWASFADVGWRKFSDVSDSAIMAFTILAAHARVMQSSVDRREESDGKVHEVYVW
jgi:hypothetical protein